MTTKEDFEVIIQLALEPERLEQYNNQDLSSICIACGKQRFQKREILQPLVEKIATSEQSIAYNDQQLANITWALGEVRCQIVPVSLMPL